MSDLGPEAQTLIRAGRSAMRPTAADRERIAAVLRTRRGLPPEPAISSASSLGWPAISAMVLGLGTVGLFVGAGAVQRALADTEAPRALTASVGAPVRAASAASTLAADSPASLPATERDRSVEAKQARARKPTADRLAEEVDILSRAQRQLLEGQFAEALKLLAEHARSFPHGTLAPERRAARIQALCALGKMSEANAELAQLKPGSLHEGRAREACSRAP